ncbi:transmembrane protein 131-like isoform X2 [Stegostoma tigrinum]|uniref:transmembrane protein 131-like isoform X2 n=1 Tax=Stegostoma tigrinum TaxID=3053191 RepID=UPI00287022CD|nr:transmembrane protein 131-like isoform X2 [Stegostoma tigrinum]
MAGLCAQGERSCCRCCRRRHHPPHPDHHHPPHHYQQWVQWLKLMLGVLQFLLPSFRQGTSAVQAFAEMTNVVELWQAEEGDVLLPNQATSEQSVDELPLEQSSANGPCTSTLHFKPQLLDFGLQPVGQPRVKEFFIQNPTWELPVVLVSVFTLSRHFHLPPIDSMIIPAGGNIILRVVFLPTEEGTVQNSLFINTSTHGTLSYQMIGVGGRNPEPVVDNQHYLDDKLIFFPHIQNIQEKSSNCTLSELSFELILPLQSYEDFPKHCLLRNEKFILYVHVSLSMGECYKEFEIVKSYLLENIIVLYLPVNKESTSDEQINTVYFWHSGNNILYIKNVHFLPGASTVTVEFEPKLLETAVTDLTSVASIVCKTAMPDDMENCSGEVTHVVKGSLIIKASPTLQLIERNTEHDSSSLFQVKAGREFWTVWFTNNFKFKIVIRDVYIPEEVSHLLTVLNFTGPVTLLPGCWHILSLQFKAGKMPRTLNTQLIIVIGSGLMLKLPLRLCSVRMQGNMYSDSILQCGVYCYLGAEAAVHWHNSLSQESSSWKVDSELGLDLRHKWQQMTEKKAKRKILLDEDHLTQQKIQQSFSTDFIWPRLTRDFLISFSVTASHNTTMKHFVLKNPSDLPVTVQLLPIAHYPNPEDVLILLKKWYKLSRQDINVTTSEFMLVKTLENESSKHVELDNKPSDGILQFTLQPWEVRKIGVEFTPVRHSLVTSLLLIRNNLTVLDAVIMEGFGANEMLKVGGKLPGEAGSLRFKVPESTLMECRGKSKGNELNLTIRKSFKVENVGPLTISVISMNINGYRCQGFGFQILKCEPFVLDANSSREISILFTPDFTTSWVIRELQLLTARGLQFEFTLNMTLPHHLLPLCADLVPALSWEQPFWIVVCLFSCLLLICVIIMAYQRAHYILTEFSQSRQRTCQDGTSINTLGSTTYKLSRTGCKTCIGGNNSPDRGKGRGALQMNGTSIRTQNTSKRSPINSSHCSKKLKYYSKNKLNTSASIGCETSEEYQQTNGGPFYSSKEQPSCTENPPNTKLRDERCTPFAGDDLEKVEEIVQECEIKPFFLETKPTTEHADHDSVTCVLSEERSSELPVLVLDNKELNHYESFQTQSLDDHLVLDESFRTDETQVVSSTTIDNPQQETMEKISENVKTDKQVPDAPQEKNCVPELQNILPPLITQKLSTTEHKTPLDKVKQKRQVKGEVAIRNKWKGRKPCGKNNVSLRSTDQIGDVHSERNYNCRQKEDAFQDQSRKVWQCGKKKANTHTKPDIYLKEAESDAVQENAFW